MSPPPLPRAVEEGLEPTEVGIAESHTLLSSFTSFLTVSIHTILYYRSIYPRHTFLSTKAYNLPVHQSRHPKVCSWIQDAVDAVAAQIAKGNVSRVAVVIHAPLSPPKLSTASSSAAASQLVPGSVLERWMFDVSLLPSWPGGAEAMKNFRSEGDGRREEEGEEPHADESGEDNAGDGDVAEGGAINWTDVDEQLRGAVRRLAYAGEKMDTLPEACTFTVAVELRGEAQAPIGVCCACALDLEEKRLTHCSILNRGFHRNQVFSQIQTTARLEKKMLVEQRRPQYEQLRPVRCFLSAG